MLSGTKLHFLLGGCNPYPPVSQFHPVPAPIVKNCAHRFRHSLIASKRVYLFHNILVISYPPTFHELLYVNMYTSELASIWLLNDFGDVCRRCRLDQHNSLGLRIIEVEVSKAVHPRFNSGTIPTIRYQPKTSCNWIPST